MTEDVTPSPADYQLPKPKHSSSLTHIPTHPKKPKHPPTALNTAPSIPSSRNRIGQILEGHPTPPEQSQPESTSTQATITKTMPAYSFPKSEYPSRLPVPDELPVVQTEIEEVKWGNKVSDRSGLEGRQAVEIKPMKEENERRKQELLNMVFNIGTIPSLEVLQLRKRFVNSEIPGPGFYNVNTDTLEVKDRRNPNPAFASTFDRFATKAEFLAQDPGKYRFNQTEKPSGFSFGRELRPMNTMQTQPEPYAIEPVAKRPAVRPSCEPFGSGSIRFRSSYTSLREPTPEPTVRQQGRSKSLRKPKKSTATLETMESDTVANLQSVDVLFHMYGNS